MPGNCHLVNNEHRFQREEMHKIRINLIKVKGRNKVPRSLALSCNEVSPSDFSQSPI